MDPYERFHRRALRDVLIAEGVLTAAQADQLTEAAYATNEQFAAVVVEAGHLTAWDLMQKVATTYQIPCMPLEGYRFDPELLTSVPPALLYEFELLPLGRFGTVWTWAAIGPPTRACIETLRAQCGPSHFFFVAETGLLQQILRENVKVLDTALQQDWASVFDDGEKLVRESIGD